MNTLLQEFNAMSKIPIFEIMLDDGDYLVFHIKADEKGIEAGGMTNSGFVSYSDQLKVEWDETMSLDSHLDALYEACCEYTLEYDIERNT
jgi:hypothetical protein